MKLEEKFLQAKRDGINEGFERGKQAGLCEGIELGKQDGIRKGIDLGKREGIESEKHSIAAKLKEAQVPHKTISETTGLSIEEIEKL